MTVTPFPELHRRDSGTSGIVSRIDTRLADLIPVETAWPAQLHAAQRHALLAPGKRIRPLLCIYVAQGCGADSETALDAACVAEMVHAASLILDDLPCMDDADLRRDRPTVHVAYSESTAILTATALLNRAFGVLMRVERVDPAIRVELGDMLSYAVGSKGLIAGQVADLANDDSAASDAEVERLNTLKTGALFDFAIDAGALLGGANSRQRQALRDFSQQLGLAFQLLDDLKDVLLSDIDAGKSTGRDIGKATLVNTSGVEAAKARLSTYRDSMYQALDRANLTTDPDVRELLDTYFALVDVG